MTSILTGIGVVIGGLLLYWLYETMKALKDPDVQIATDLHMSIKRYRKYERLYDAHQSVMMKFGVNSQEEESFFKKEVFPNLPNLNEWKRYQDYRSKVDQANRTSLLKNNDNQWQPTPMHKAFGSPKN